MNEDKYERAWKRLYQRYSHTSADVIADLKVMHDLITLHRDTRKKLNLALFILAKRPSIAVDSKMSIDEWERWLEDDV